MNREEIAFTENDLEVMTAAFGVEDIESAILDECADEIEAIMAVIKRFIPSPPIQIGDKIEIRESEDLSTYTTKVKEIEVQLWGADRSDGTPRFVWWINHDIPFDPETTRVIKNRKEHTDEDNSNRAPAHQVRSSKRMRNRA